MTQRDEQRPSAGRQRVKASDSGERRGWQRVQWRGAESSDADGRRRRAAARVAGDTRMSVCKRRVFGVLQRGGATTHTRSAQMRGAAARGSPAGSLRAMRRDGRL